MAGNIVGGTAAFVRGNYGKIRSGMRSGLNGAGGFRGLLGTSRLRGAGGLARHQWNGMQSAFKQGGWGAMPGAALGGARAWGRLGMDYFGAADLAGKAGGWSRGMGAASRIGAAGAGMAAADFFNPFGFGWND